MVKLLQDYSIGKNIQILRLNAHMTQVNLVVAMADQGRAMSIHTLSQIENGRRNIFVSDLIRLKLIFDVSFDEFFKDMY